MSALTNIDNRVTDNLIATVTDYVQSTMAWLGPIYLNIVVIYIALLGYLLWAGKIEFPLRDIAIHLFRIALVSTFALGLGWYSKYVIDMAFSGPGEILAGITGGNPDTVSALDNLWSDITKSANDKDRTCGISNLGSCVESWFLYASAFLACVPIFFIVVFSKIMSSLLLIVGPIFIVCALFKKGTRFAEAWLSQFLNYFFLYLLIVLLGHLTGDLFVEMQAASDKASATADAFSIAMEMLLVGALLAGSAFVIPQLAGALAGAMAVPVSAGLAYIPGAGQIMRTVTSIGGRQGSSGKSQPGGNGYLKKWNPFGSKSKRK